MGVRDNSTRRADSSIDLGEELPSLEEFDEFDNHRDRPVALRENGNSIVQTMPRGLCGVLDLQSGMTPRIAFNADANAVIFIYE